MADDDVRRHELEIIAQHLANAVNRELCGLRVGWLVVTFDFGDDGSMAYAANAKRGDVVKMLRELASKLEGN